MQMAFIQFNDDWRDMVKGQRVQLLKYVDGAWKVVDFGYAKFTDQYLAKGFIVKPIINTGKDK